MPGYLTLASLVVPARVIRSAAGVLLTFYLVLYASVGAPLLQQAWREGAHLTPVQSAYHVWLDALGLPHHHGSARRGPGVASGQRDSQHDSASAAAAVARRALLQLHPLAPALRAPLGVPGAPNPDTTSTTATELRFGSTVGSASQRAGPTSSRAHPAAPVQPPEQPPRPVA